MTGRLYPKKSKTGAVAPTPAAEVADAPISGVMHGVERQIAKLAASPLLPALYLVSTPIGNLSDISIRALHTLASADIALCEDTRHSRKLLSAYGINRRLEAYHDFSSENDRARVLSALGDGKSVALISDAGTPLISDPGYKLARDAIAGGFQIYAVPGPSAALAALVTSGLPPDRFYFGGFLPPKEGARRAELEMLQSVQGTLIFYESGSRIEETLRAMATIFPDRPIVITRELTKLHEAVLRGSATELLDEIQENTPPGEFVLLVGAGTTKPATAEDVEKALRAAMQKASLKEAVDEVAKGLGVGRKAVYNLALQLRERKQ
jgi:16S rRNA (cytidine1402-2'-O)-methyltransferase